MSVRVYGLMNQALAKVPRIDERHYERCEVVHEKNRWMSIGRVPVAWLLNAEGISEDDRAPLGWSRFASKSVDEATIVLQLGVV